MLSHRVAGSGVLLAAICSLSLGCVATPPASPSPPAVGSKDEEAGFTPLFNGKDLSGWVGDTTGYIVENGAIVCGPQGRNLYTEREYGNFVLRLEFQLTPGANNGIGIRTPREGDPAYVGMELQVLDNTAEKYRELKSYQYHGSIYGVIAAKREFLKPVGEWNEQEIRVDGRRVRITLNGTVIVDADLDEVTRGGTIDGQAHPGLARTTGHIAFCGHGDRVAYRKLRLRELPGS
jgi:hypothetical protein